MGRTVNWASDGNVNKIHCKRVIKGGTRERTKEEIKEEDDDMYNEQIIIIVIIIVTWYVFVT